MTGDAGTKTKETSGTAMFGNGIAALKTCADNGYNLVEVSICTTEDVIVPSIKKDTPEEEKPKDNSGKCRHCGKWQSGLRYHENNVCDKRFGKRRK